MALEVLREASVCGALTASAQPARIGESAHAAREPAAIRDRSSLCIRALTPFSRYGRMEARARHTRRSNHVETDVSRHDQFG